jgi:hypothetical protein
MLKEIRGQLFTWFGIVGGALTIVNHWSNFITLADWMHVLVQHWAEWLHGFWNLIGSIFGIRVSRQVASGLSITGFFLFITIGTIYRYGRKNFNLKRSDTIHKIMLYISRTLVIIIPIDAVFSIIPENYDNYFISIGIFCIIYLNLNGVETLYRLYGSAIYLILLFSALPLLKMFLYADSPISIYAEIILSICVITSLVLPIVLAPPRPLIRRITFLLIGVGLILGLSEFSKFVEQLKTASDAPTAVARQTSRMS